MGSTYFTNPIVFLIQVLFGTYILFVMLRFLLQWLRADFYHPISQFILKVTSPVLNPLRKLIPGWGGLDIASIVLIFMLQLIELTLVVAVLDVRIGLLDLIMGAMAALIQLTINVFLFAIVIQAVISWVNPHSYNPVTDILYSLTNPILKPIRERLPPVSGLDFSPFVAIIGLQLLKMLIIPLFLTSEVTRHLI